MAWGKKTNVKNCGEMHETFVDPWISGFYTRYRGGLSKDNQKLEEYFRQLGE